MPDKMDKPLPTELAKIVQELPGDVTILSIDFWSMGWVAFLKVQNKTFKLVSDRGYIDTYVVAEDQAQHLLPPADQRLAITPAQILRLIEGALSSR